MKYLLIIAVAACCIVGLESAFGRSKRSRSDTAAEYEKLLFDPSSQGDIDTNEARKMVFYLHDSYTKDAKLGDRASHKNLIDKLVFLTQKTVCSDENNASFEHLINAGSAYKNFVALVERERDSYKNVCVEYDDQKLPWNAEVRKLRHHVRGDATNGYRKDSPKK